MQRHLEKPALPARVDARHAPDGAATEVAADEMEAAGAFRDQHAVVGQEGERPGMIQPFHQLHHPEGLGAGGQRQKQNEREREAHARLS
jgi:hypothetical protein